jgi:NADH dehydrogenase
VSELHRVVIVGAGFGGLAAAKELAHEPVEVVVLDRTNHHLFQPLLYQVATGILSAGEIAPSIREVLRHQTNVTVRVGEVTGIDLAAKTVTTTFLDGTATHRFDSLILACGMRTSYFGHDELARYAHGMKTIDDALKLRARIFGALETAEDEADERVRRQWLTFAVVGGGPTGVELAGQIRELAQRSLDGNFRRFDPPRDIRVVLLDGDDAVLGAFGPKLSGSALRQLTGMGVDVRLGLRVTGADAEGVDVQDATGKASRIEARTIVWAAGVRANGVAGLLAEAAGVSPDRQGRLPVEPDCTLPGHPEVFVVGDVMARDDLPGLAEVAMQSGKHAARTIAHRQDGRAAPGPFRYLDLGSMATISRFHAVAEFRRLRLTGAAAWLLWLVVHLVFLTGFRNRLSALWHWGYSFLGRGRSERTITYRQADIPAHLDPTHRQ